VAGHRARARAAAPSASTFAPSASTFAPATKPAGPSEDLTTLASPEETPAPARDVSSPAPGATRGTAGGRRRWVLPLVALVASLALLGTVLGVSLRDSGDKAALERAASSQARTSIEQMLSYNYKTIDAQSAQIEGLLTGSFKGEFTKAMDTQIKPLAVKNQTVVQARVSDIGVMSSSPTTVKVMAFVNQARVGSDGKDPVVDQNRVLATMSKVGDRWLISRVDAF
jgi:Mce-associated membrane protein